MIIPEWLGYIILMGGTAFIVGVGLGVLVIFGNLLINHVLPTIWVMHKRMKIKNMPKETFEKYIYSLRQEWTENYIEKGKKENGESER